MLLHHCESIGRLRRYNPNNSRKLLTLAAPFLPILLVIRLNIHSWGDLMSRYNSPSVMISAPLPSAPVRSNLRPLQEVIIRRGKSYVSLTMLHFHHNSSHFLPANSYLLQTIRVYCSWAIQHLTSQTHTHTQLFAQNHTHWQVNLQEIQWMRQNPKLTDWRSVFTPLPQGVKENVHWVNGVFCQFLWLKVNQMCAWNMTDAVGGDSFKNVYPWSCSRFAFKNEGKS